MQILKDRPAEASASDTVDTVIAAPAAPARDTPVKLSTGEQDAILRAEASEASRPTVPTSGNQRAGETRAWDEAAQID